MTDDPELYTLNSADEAEQDWELEDVEPHAFTLEHSPDDSEETCHYCHGAGWGVIGTDWDCDDPINGPYDGETERCPCCGSSGKAEDCTFW